MPQETHKKEIRIEDYFWTIWRSKFSILIIFFVAVMTAFVKNDVSPPIYEAKCIIWIKDEQTKMPFFEDLLIGSSLGRTTRIETLQEIIRSRYIVTQTVEELKLDETPLPKHRGKIISGLAGVLGFDLKNEIYDEYTEDIRYYKNELIKLRDENPIVSDIEKCLTEINKSWEQILQTKDNLADLDKNYLDDYEKAILSQIKDTSRRLASQTSELISYQDRVGFELHRSESPRIDRYLVKIEELEGKVYQVSSNLESQLKNLEKEREFLGIQKTKLSQRAASKKVNDEEIGKTTVNASTTNASTIFAIKASGSVKASGSINKRIEVLADVAGYVETAIESTSVLLENRKQFVQFSEQELEVGDGKEKGERGKGKGVNSLVSLRVFEAFYVITESERLRYRRCIDGLRENLTVKSLRETNLIEVSVKNKDSVRAQEIVNTIAKNFKNYMREDMQIQMQVTTDFAGGKVEEIKIELGKAEDNLAEFQHENNMVDLETEAEMIITNIEKFKAQLTAIKEQKAGANATLKSLVEELSGIEDKVISSETLTNNPILTALRQNEIYDKVRLAELKEKYPTGEHAEIDRLNAKIKQEQEAIGELETNIMSKTTTLNPIHQQLTSDIIQAQSQIDASNAQEMIIESRILEYNELLMEMPKKQVELAKKKRDVVLYQKLLTSLQETKQQADIFREAEVGNVKELDRAYEPDEPIGPRKKVNLLLGAMIGLSLGVGLAFLRDTIDNRYHTIEEAQRDFDGLAPAPVYLGLIPPIIGDDNQARGTSVPLMSNISRRGDNVLEAFRMMRTKLQFLKTSSELETMVVTSSVPGEGKSTIAVNTAITLGRMEKKVLIIDADLRRPRLHKAFEKTSRPYAQNGFDDSKPLAEYESSDYDKKPGLSELLLEIGHGGSIGELSKRITRTIASEDANSSEGHENVYLITSGTKPPEPSQLLGSESMQKLLDYLKKQYDYIVIDAPPAGFADPIVLSEKVDCVLYVIDLAKAKKTEVRNGLENLIEIAEDKSTPIGVVCNWAQMPHIGYYYGYYYGGYYSYYRYRYGYYGSYYYDYYEDRKEKKKRSRLKNFLFRNKKKQITARDDEDEKR